MNDEVKDEEIKDATQKVIVEDKEVKAEETAATSVIDSVLEEYGHESVEDFIEEYKTSKELRDQVGDADISKLMGAQQELERIHAYWAEQEALAKEKDELPEETIERLKQEKKAQELEYKRSFEEIANREKNDKVVEAYCSEINSILGKEGLSKSEKDFANKFFGVNNPFNEIDISNKVAIQKMVKDGLKGFKEFKLQIIDDYRKGKIEVPEMSESDQTSVTSGEKKIKSIKKASEVFAEMLSKK